MRLDQLGDFQRTHRNGDLRLDHAGQTVRLLGWCRRVRNLGSLVFLDLRDRWAWCSWWPTRRPRTRAC